MSGDSDFVSNRHFEREIQTLREFAKARLDATDRSMGVQGGQIAATNQQIRELQRSISDVVGRLDRAEGGTARHSATVAMAVSISAVIMSLVVGGLSIIKTSSHPEVIYKERPPNPPNIDGS